jgi:hypothetical protein
LKQAHVINVVLSHAGVQQTTLRTVDILKHPFFRNAWDIAHFISAASNYLNELPNRSQMVTGLVGQSVIFSQHMASYNKTMNYLKFNPSRVGPNPVFAFLKEYLPRFLPGTRENPGNKTI